jgi:hypothetical protein
MNVDPAHPYCLPRCDAQNPCSDPLLECRSDGGGGTLDFSVPAGEPPGSTWCAPRRCTANADCGPGGTCPAIDGGQAYCTK